MSHPEQKTSNTTFPQEHGLAEALISASQDAVITIDRQGRIQLFNSAAERIFGYTHAEVVGRAVEILMPELYAKEHQDYITRYERIGERRAIGRIRTVAAQRKNGQVFPIELSVTAIRTDGDTRYGAFIRDISEKIRLQEQLFEKERLAVIGTTAATFAHEVGNPLNSMYMAAQLLERRLGKEQALVTDAILTPLHNVMNEMRRLQTLLEEFRMLARRQNLTLKLVSLPTLITNLCTAEALFSTEHSVAVVYQFSSDLPEIEADDEKLTQVFLNLYKNAIEAMAQGGTLTLHAEQEGDRIKLEVSDTGTGIPLGIDIFEPFATTKTQGTGLGLTIVRQIISAHKGTLRYHSIPGQGTTFTIELPLKHTSNNS